MKKILAVAIAVTSLSACDQQKVAQAKADAAPFVKDAVDIATPIVNKGVELAKEAYPVAKQALQEGADAVGRIDLKEVQQSLKEPAVAAAAVGAQAQAQPSAGPDSRGNLDYGLSKGSGPDQNGNLDYGLGK